MSEIKNGGPAFPSPESKDAQGDLIWPMEAGMALRDYFAAKAMQGEIASPTLVWDEGIEGRVAFRAYAFADAMLKAREL